MRIVLLCFLTFLVALVGANRRRNYNYESYPTFPGTPLTWSKSQWNTGIPQTTPVQVNYYSSALRPNSGRVTYNGYGHGKSWSNAGTGQDSILYGGSRLQGSGDYFGEYGAGVLSSGIQGGKQTYSTSTGKKVLQGSGLRFGFDKDSFVGNSATNNQGATDNIIRNGLNTNAKSIFGINTDRSYGIHGSYGSYGRGTQWNTGSFFAPAGVKPMYGDISSIYGQSQFTSGQTSASIPSSISNLYGDAKWNDRGVYAGYGGGLDYYWKWRKNGFQPFNAAPTRGGRYQAELSGSFNGLQSGLVGRPGSSNQYAIGSTPLSTKIYGTVSTFGSGSINSGLGVGAGVTNNDYSGSSSRPYNAFISGSKFSNVPDLTSGSAFTSGNVFGFGNKYNQNAAYKSGTALKNSAASLIGLSPGSGVGQTANVFNLYGTKLSGSTIPVVSSNILGTYVSGKYEQRPYSTVGIHPMYSQKEWTLDNSGKQTGYYVGYGKKSGIYSSPIKFNVGYGTSSADQLSGPLQFNTAQSLSPQANTALYAGNSAGNNAFSSNLYSDTKWNQRGVYSGYGNGLDFYWSWRNNGFKNPSPSATGSYTGFASSNTNKYEQSLINKQGGHYTGSDLTGSGLAAGSGLTSQKPPGSITLLGGSLSALQTSSKLSTGATDSGALFSQSGSFRPIGPEFAVGTNQYFHTSAKPSFSSIVFNQNTNKLSSVSFPSKTTTGFNQLSSNSPFGSGSYSAAEAQYATGSKQSGSNTAFSGGIFPSATTITSGSLNAGYRPATTLTSFNTSPIKQQVLLTSSSPFNSGNFANLNNAFNYNSNKFSTGITPMYSQSKWSVGNGYYAGYGQNSRIKYKPTSYRPGYISSIKQVYPSSTGSQYTPAQSGFVQLTPAAFPNTAGIIGTSGFSSSLYNSGKWNSRGTYYGYGSGLDDYWRWRKNGFRGDSSSLTGGYSSLQGSYDNNQYSSQGSGQTLINSGLTGATNFNANLGLANGQALSGSGNSGFIGNKVFVDRKPVTSAISFGGSYTANKVPSGISGSDSSASYSGSYRPTSSGFNVNSGQYNQVYSKPISSSLAFYQNANKLPSVGFPSTTVTGFSQLSSNSPFGSGSYSATGAQYVTGSKQSGFNTAFSGGIFPSATTITSGSLNAGYRPATTLTSFNTSPITQQVLLTSSSPFNSGNFANLNNAFNYNSNKFSTGITPMYSQSKWSIGNGYYAGYGQNSGIKYKPTSYRPGYISSIKQVYPSSTGSQYTPAQSGFVQLTPAAFPNTAGIIGTSGFSSSLYNSGKWNSRGTYYGYGSELDDYWRWRKNGFQGGSSSPTGEYSSLHGSYNKYGGSSWSNPAERQTSVGGFSSGTLGGNLNSNLVNGQMFSGSDSSASASGTLAKNKFFTSKLSTIASPISLAQLSSGSKPLLPGSLFGAAEPSSTIVTGAILSGDSIKDNPILTPSIASFVNELSELSPAETSIYGAFVPTKFQNKPYSTSGITPMYSQNKWTIGGSGLKGGYYTGYGSNSGTDYSATKLRPNYSSQQYSTSNIGSAQNIPGRFPTGIGSSFNGLNLNLYGANQWSNNGVYSGYAKNPSSFWNHLSTSNYPNIGSLSGYSALNRPNVLSSGTGQGQYVLSSKYNSQIPSSLGIGCGTGTNTGTCVSGNIGYNEHWPSAGSFGTTSMYNDKKWLLNNGGLSTGVYYGYAAQPNYPSKVQAVSTGSAQLGFPLSAIKNNGQYQLSGNTGLYSGADWRYNGVYSGYGGGLDSYWRWRKGGFVGDSGKTSNAFANSILGNLHGSKSISSFGGLSWQSESSGTREEAGNNFKANFANPWTTAVLWGNAPINGANAKISQWSSGTNPSNWHVSGTTKNYLKTPLAPLSYTWK